MMNQCEHGKLIIGFCMNSSCRWREAGGCEICLRKFHTHSQKCSTLTLRELEEMCDKLEVKEEMRVKATRLQETINSYLVDLKSQVVSSMESVLKYMMDQINYPYCYDEVQANICNKIKNRQYKEMTRHELQMFCSIVNKQNAGYIEFKQKVYLNSQIVNIKNTIKNINIIFVNYFKIVQKIDTNFYFNQDVYQQIQEICTSFFSTPSQNTSKLSKIQQTSTLFKDENYQTIAQQKMEIGFTTQNSSLSANRTNKLQNIQIRKKSMCESKKISADGRIRSIESNHLKNRKSQQLNLNDPQKQKTKMKNRIFDKIKNQSLKVGRSKNMNQPKETKQKDNLQSKQGQQSLTSKLIHISSFIKKKSASLNNYQNLKHCKQALIPKPEQQHQYSIKFNSSSKEQALSKALKQPKQGVKIELCDNIVKHHVINTPEVIVHTMLPKPEQKPKLYVNTQDVKERKISIPIKRFEEQEEKFSPFLRKKKQNRKKSDSILQHEQGVLKEIIPQINMLVTKNGKNQNNQPKCHLIDHSVKCQEDDKPLVKDNQTYSIALLMQSLRLPAQKAIPLLKASLKYAHNNLSAAEYLSYLYLQASKPKDCLEVCNKILQQVEGNPHVYELSVHITNNKAAALNLLGRSSQTIFILEKCLEITKRDIYFKTLGDAYFSIGIYERAIKNYENAIKLNNFMQQAYYNLSVCLYLQDNYYEAEFNVIEALKINSQNQQYQKLNQEIRKKIRE